MAKNLSETVEYTPSELDAPFRTYIENLPVMFYAVTAKPPHTPLYISPTFEQFGYPLDDWMTKPDIWDLIIHPDDREEVLNNTRAAMRTGDSIDFEYRVVCQDGSLMWVRDRSCFIKDKLGNPLCRQGVILDVTERRNAEQELEKREKLYRTLARTIPRTAVLLFDHDFRYTLADGEQLKNHKWSQEMFEGKTLFDVFPDDVTQEWAGYYRRALNGEAVCVEMENEGGAFQVSVLPVHDENGDTFAGMVMWQDITEKKCADDQIRDSEARYRQLYENANDIIYVHDLEGNYISINGVAERVLGYTNEEALKLNMTDFAAPEHLQIVKDALAKKVSGSSPQTVYEIDCIRKDGTTVTLEVNSSVISKDGKPVAVQGIARDITERKHAEEALRKSEERYRELFENANDLIYTHDMQGNFTSLNRAGEIITGYTREEALGMNIGVVVAPEFLDAARTMTAKKVAGERPSTYELEIISKTGERVTLELSTRLIVSPDGLPLGVQGLGRDITARRQAEASLHETLSLFATTFESTADGIVVMSLDRGIVTCNQKFIEMWGVAPELIAEKNGGAVVDLVASQLKDPEKFMHGLNETYKTPHATVSEVLELADGRIIERHSQPQYLEDKPIGRVACFRDITERSRAEERLRYYALHDTLTDLPNRVQFMNHLHRAVERAEGNDFARFAVLFLDLDRFKVINDSLGHAVGDKLLVAIAEKLSSCVRPGDIVARLGGDEFTILLNRTGDQDEVAAVAERLQARISEPFKIDNYEVFTTASIGIILSADCTARTAEDFLRDADAAMYRAKESGKARYEIFDQEMHVRNMNLLRVETDLRHAVERNEFEVLYQPIVDLDSGSVKEFEALIRWRHPVHGLVAPDEFIEVAEETGLIIPIGRWIIEESCRQIVEWQRKFGIELAVSVNLSAKQLMHPNLTSQVSDILAETGLAADQLKLEVTESTVMEHSDRSLKVLSELDALGIALSTDDFGTGYSSLSYLQKFPFERLKIDRSFIKIMDQDAKSGAIVKTILMLGENLGIEVVAEGIESASQLEKLRQLGCRMGQGYLFSRPVDRESVEAMIEAGANIFADQPDLRLMSSSTVVELADVQ
ncbi:MAG TPA: PAS domain S-box protein [Pyrinomonadaceae bacterium]|nr:PAS domain S-box protein [Pyrinomonadaceae bacterium]